MAKKVPQHLRDKARKCVFCKEPGCTHTHIWPDWLNRLLTPSGGRQDHERFERPDHYTPDRLTTKFVRQGSIFSIKPYLCCEACNTGWMHNFEDEMTRFAQPMFSGPNPILINAHQRRVISVWISVITVLAEYVDRAGSNAISQAEKDIIRERFMPPDNWTIVASTLNGTEWFAKYKRHFMWLEDFASMVEYGAAMGDRSRPKNTQISSFGLGHLFIQVFSCLNERFIIDYRIAAKARGLVQLWPPATPLLPFWPFAKRLTKFPTKLILDDNEADVIASAFYERIQIQTKPRGTGSRWEHR
jgi:hypothetical protein